MTFKTLGTLIAALITQISVTASAQNLNTIIDPIIARHSPNAHVGVVVMDAKTGATIYNRNGYQYFRPASNTKVVTALASLYELGPDYRYRTTLSTPEKAIVQGVLSDLYIQFAGDPSLTHGDLAALIHELKQYGIKTIKGDLIIDTSVFSGPDHPTGATLEDLNSYYLAPVTSVILDRNIGSVSIKAADRLGAPPEIQPTKSGRRFFTIDNKMQTRTQTDSKLCPMDIRIDTQNVAHFSGCWPIDIRQAYERLAINNPIIPATKIIREQLAKDGIHLQGQVREGHVPPNTRVIATHESQPLRLLLVRMLGRSDNLYADSFLKAMGVKRYKIGSFSAGVASEKAVLSEHTSLNVDKMQIKDGSGMDDLLTPVQLTNCLLAIYQDSKIYKIFKNTLPINGKRGTLSNRMKSPLMIKRVMAKTGRMRDISSLSGFVKARSNRQYIFSIITNNHDLGVKAAQRMESAILDAVIRNG